MLQSTGEEIHGEELHEILKEIDTNMNGQVELDEYLQVSIFMRKYCLKFFEPIFYSHPSGLSNGRTYLF